MLDAEFKDGPSRYRTGHGAKSMPVAWNCYGGRRFREVARFMRSKFWRALLRVARGRLPNLLSRCAPFPAERPGSQHLICSLRKS